jgi:hypothetical protein
MRGINEPQNTNIFYNDVLNTSNKGINDPQQNDGDMLRLSRFL